MALAQHLIALLDRQRDEREALIAGANPDDPSHSYANRVHDVAMAFPDGPPVSTAGTRFDTIVRVYEECHQVTTEQLRQLLLEDPPATDDGGVSIESDSLGHAATLVAKVLQRHAICVGARSDRPDWRMAVRVLEYHGWDCGRGSLGHKADRLRHLVRRLPDARTLLKRTQSAV
jgi:hypothetical protein